MPKFTVILLRPAHLSGNRDDVSEEIYVAKVNPEASSVPYNEVKSAIRMARKEAYQADLDEHDNPEDRANFADGCAPKDYDVLYVFKGHPRTEWFSFQPGINNLDR